MSKAIDTHTAEAFRRALDRLKELGDVGPLRFRVGEPVSFEPATEADHFMVCPRCSQPIDCRDLGAALHHEEPGHRPLSLREATRMVTAPALRAALLEGRWRPGVKVTN